jgi:hypothetical protein
MVALVPYYFSSILPEARGTAVRASFEQIATLPGADAADDAAVWEALRRLSVPREGDAPPVTARRTTLAQVVERVAGLCGTHSHLTPDDSVEGARPWFQAQIDAWTSSTDPRQKAMAATAARELAEVLG